MEKYGVKESLTKEAQKGTRTKCPRCGADIQRKGSVLWCPNCGTEPFEEETRGEEEDG